MLRDFLEANWEMKGDIEANTNNFVGIFSVTDFQYNNMLLILYIINLVECICSKWCNF